MAIKQKNIAPFDIDAQRFILAAGISRYDEKRALNYLVTGLKVNKLWAKCNAIYPMVGGNAYSCKLNLKNTMDSDAAFRLVFNGGWTFSNNGALPNGTTGFADTKINCNTVLNVNDNHLCFYSRTNSTVIGPYEIAASSTVPSYFLFCCGRTLDNLTFYEQGGGYYSTATIMPFNGCFLGTRTASGASNIFMYRNGSLITAGTGLSDGSSGLPNFNLYICAHNSSGTAINFSQKQCAYASIGSGLSATDVFNYNNLIQQFQIILNRAV